MRYIVSRRNNCTIIKR